MATVPFLGAAHDGLLEFSKILAIPGERPEIANSPISRHNQTWGLAVRERLIEAESSIRGEEPPLPLRYPKSSGPLIISLSP